MRHETLLDRVCWYFFGIVTTLAAVVTVYTWASAPASVLRGEAYFHRYLIDSDARAALSLRSIARVTRPYGVFDTDVECDKVADLKPAVGEYCQAVAGLEQASARMPSEINQGGTVVEISLFNEGNRAAEGIRLSDQFITHVDLRQVGGQYRSVKQSEDLNFNIPNINPGEKIEILVFYSLSPYDITTVYPERHLPNLSYSDGLVDIVPFIHGRASLVERVRLMNSLTPVLYVVLVALLGLMGLVTWRDILRRAKKGE